jgi:hypothetical protein
MDRTHRSGRRRQWGDLTGRERAGIVAGGAAQLALAAVAWADLARRPSHQVRGPKPVWAGVIAISWVGPVLYFVRGVSRRGEPVPLTG